ncbi:hypothetical protein PhCBS80983_g02586 [Powellomyces hirtus]|uniref:FHA domain-containing protein n=1 Tax=Powellomyces hirtus TaxID=109895 RepID=A0A507E680_9FUNG|nr:hypothetical protein PhCBS80983_g02586 [Powellomyces hirtus]
MSETTTNRHNADLNQLIDQFAREAQSLVLSYQKLIGNTGSSETLNSQWKAIESAAGSLQHAIGTRDETLLPHVAQLRMVVERILKQQEQNEGKRPQADRDFTKSVLALLTAVKEVVKVYVEQPHAASTIPNAQTASEEKKDVEGKNAAADTSQQQSGVQPLRPSRGDHPSGGNGRLLAPDAPELHAPPRSSSQRQALDAVAAGLDNPSQAVGANISSSSSQNTTTEPPLPPLFTKPVRSSPSRTNSRELLNRYSTSDGHMSDSAESLTRGQVRRPSHIGSQEMKPISNSTESLTRGQVRRPSHMGSQEMKSFAADENRKSPIGSAEEVGADSGSDVASHNIRIEIHQDADRKSPPLESVSENRQAESHRLSNIKEQALRVRETADATQPGTDAKVDSEDNHYDDDESAALPVTPSNIRVRDFAYDSGEGVKYDSRGNVIEDIHDNSVALPSAFTNESKPSAENEQDRESNSDQHDDERVTDVTRAGASQTEQTEEAARPELTPLTTTQPVSKLASIVSPIFGVLTPKPETAPSKSAIPAATIKIVAPTAQRTTQPSQHSEIPSSSLTRAKAELFKQHAAAAAPPVKKAIELNRAGGAPPARKPIEINRAGEKIVVQLKTTVPLKDAPKPAAKDAPMDRLAALKAQKQANRRSLMHVPSVRQATAFFENTITKVTESANSLKRPPPGRKPGSPGGYSPGGGGNSPTSNPSINAKEGAEPMSPMTSHDELPMPTSLGASRSSLGGTLGSLDRLQEAGNSEEEEEGESSSALEDSMSEEASQSDDVDNDAAADVSLSIPQEKLQPHQQPAVSPLQESPSTVKGDDEEETNKQEHSLPLAAPKFRPQSTSKPVQAPAPSPQAHTPSTAVERDDDENADYEAGDDSGFKGGPIRRGPSLQDVLEMAKDIIGDLKQEVKQAVFGGAATPEQDPITVMRMTVDDQQRRQEMQSEKMGKNTDGSEIRTRPVSESRDKDAGAITLPVSINFGKEASLTEKAEEQHGEQPQSRAASRPVSEHIETDMNVGEPIVTQPQSHASFRPASKHIETDVNVGQPIEKPSQSRAASRPVSQNIRTDFSVLEQQPQSRATSRPVSTNIETDTGIAERTEQQQPQSRAGSRPVSKNVETDVASSRAPARGSSRPVSKNITAESGLPEPSEKGQSRVSSRPVSEARGRDTGYEGGEKTQQRAISRPVSCKPGSTRPTREAHENEGGDRYAEETVSTQETTLGGLLTENDEEVSAITHAQQPAHEKPANPAASEPVPSTSARPLSAHNRTSTRKSSAVSQDDEPDIANDDDTFAPLRSHRKSSANQQSYEQVHYRSNSLVPLQDRDTQPSSERQSVVLGSDSEERRYPAPKGLPPATPDIVNALLEKRTAAAERKSFGLEERGSTRKSLGGEEQQGGVVESAPQEQPQEQQQQQAQQQQGGAGITKPKDPRLLHLTKKEGFASSSATLPDQDAENANNLPATAPTPAREPHPQAESPDLAEKAALSAVAGALPTSTPDATSTPTAGTVRLTLSPENGQFTAFTLNLGSSAHRLGRGLPKEGFRAFTSQVVSRNHCDFLARDGRVFVRDCGSNSGTFVNGVRLSNLGVESDLCEVKNGDSVQLGKDYEGKAGGNVPEARRKCVKMLVRIETIDGPTSQPGSKTDLLANTEKQLPPLPVAPPRTTSEPDGMDINRGDVNLGSNASVDSLPKEATSASDIRDGHKADQGGGGGFPTATLRIKTSSKGGSVPASTSFDDLVQAIARGEIGASGPVLPTEIAPTASLTADQHHQQQQAPSASQSKPRVSQPQGWVDPTTAAAVAAAPLPAEKTAAANTSSGNVSAASLPRGLSVPRSRYAISISGTKDKARKIHVVSGADGAEGLIVGLKFWDTKRVVMVQDQRSLYASSNPAFEIFPDPRAPSDSPLSLLTPFVVTTATGAGMGKFQYISDLKLAVESAPRFSSGSSPSLPGSLTNLNGSNSATDLRAPLPLTNEARSPMDRTTPTPVQYAGPSFTLAGDLKEHKYIIVMRLPNSREQKVVGEAHGRQLAKKSVLENRWVTQVDIEEGTFGQLFMAAVLFVALSGGT